MKRLFLILTICIASVSCEKLINNSKVPDYTVLEFVIVDKSGGLVNIAETAEENDLRIVRNRETIRLEPTNDTRATISPLPIYDTHGGREVNKFEFSNNGYTLTYGMIGVCLGEIYTDQLKVIYGENYWDVAYDIEYKDGVMTATLTVNGEEVNRELRSIPTENGESYEVAVFPLQIYAE